jgi:hypothetical protein
VTTPQQRELRRPRRSAAEPIPEDNVPGHHPAIEQDKPDLDAVAEALGTKPPVRARRRSAKEPT